MIQVVKIEDAVGYPLAHDITEIRPGEFKGPAFLKGQILRGQDLEHLRRLGKNHLYILKTERGEMHEDEAAVEIANALCGEGVGWSGVPREGKISLKATRDGLLKVDVDALMRFNLLGEVMCATLHRNTVVQSGHNVAATRAIPLVVARTIIRDAVAAAKTSACGVLRVLPMKKARVGVMITVNDVYYGRIKDKFEPIIRSKVAELGCTVQEVVFLPDDDLKIAQEACRLADEGADVLITTGGMSVDPDDRTRHALKKAGARDMVYGSAVLPGAMFMAAYLNDVPVLGIPACGMYASRTILDLVLPRVLTGEKITRHEVAELGHGGLCLKCETCTYPRCAFGK
ncbi:MAG: molybdopterin-binding protein [Desulfobacteraceae bacterium]